MANYNKLLDFEGEPVGPLITELDDQLAPACVSVLKHDLHKQNKSNFYTTAKYLAAFGGEVVRALVATRANKMQQYFPSPE